MSTEQAVVAELSRHTSRAPNEISADTELLSSGLLDSLGLVAVVTWIEDSYGVTIDVTDIVADNFETPTAIAALIDHVANHAA